MIIDNIVGRIGRAIEKLLCHEREVLSIPDVIVVKAYEKRDTSQVTDETVGQCIQWKP